MKYAGLAAVVGCHLATRLVGLLALPIFNDEAIYLRMAQLVRQGHGLVSLSHESLKPLFVWLLALCWPLADDPLVMGRLVAIACGAATVAVIYLTLYRWGGKGPALLAGAFYVLLPMALFHDKMALYEPLLTLLSAVSLAAAWSLVETRTWKAVVVFGLAAGLGLATKEFALFFLLYPLAGVVARWRARQPVGKGLWSRVGVAWLLAGVIWLALVFIPSLTTAHGILHGQVGKYAFSAAELAAFPFDKWAANLVFTSDALGRYLGPLFALGLLASAVWSLWRRRENALFVALCWAGPLVALLLVGRTLFSRYFLFLVPAMVAAVALAVWAVAQASAKDRGQRGWWILAALTAAILVFPASLAWKVTFQPHAAPLPSGDREQHLDGWAAGSPWPSVKTYLEQAAATEPIAVFVAPVPGLYHDVLKLYVEGPRVQVWPVPWVLEKSLTAFTSGDQTTRLPTSIYLRDLPLREADPADWRRAFFLINVPQLRLEPFMRLNPNAKLAHVSRHAQGKAFVALMELPVREPEASSSEP
ncbi:MAG: glycosyltransferase family 39 protein [Candidatus Lernaella stagnicola]|nr:glycosyltransferase family 39 protein [Candidatus Lernaella stagnicola]